MTQNKVVVVDLSLDANVSVLWGVVVWCQFCGVWWVREVRRTICRCREKYVYSDIRLKVHYS